MPGRRTGVWKGRHVVIRGDRVCYVSSGIAGDEAVRVQLHAWLEAGVSLHRDGVDAAALQGRDQLVAGADRLCHASQAAEPTHTASRVVGAIPRILVIPGPAWGRAVGPDIDRVIQRGVQRPASPGRAIRSTSSEAHRPAVRAARQRPANRFASSFRGRRIPLHPVRGGVESSREDSVVVASSTGHAVVAPGESHLLASHGVRVAGKGAHLSARVSCRDQSINLPGPRYPGAVDYSFLGDRQAVDIEIPEAYEEEVNGVRQGDIVHIVVEVRGPQIVGRQKHRNTRGFSLSHDIEKAARGRHRTTIGNPGPGRER